MSSCLKIGFGISCFICSALAIVLSLGGIWYVIRIEGIKHLRNYETYQLNTKIDWTEVSPYVFSAIGAFGLFITCCGLCSSLITSRSCIIAFIIFSITLAVAMAACGVTTILIAVDHTESFYNKTLTSAFQESLFKDAARKGFEEIESDFHCCGVRNSQDYMYHQISKSVGLEDVYKLPRSCCDDGTDCSGVVNPRHGCVEVSPYVFSAIGAFGLFITCCGLCSSLITSRSCIIAFIIFSITLAVAMAACGVTTILIAVDHTESFYNKTLTSAFQESLFKDAARKGFEEIESDFHCCGVRNSQDYMYHQISKSVGLEDVYKLPRSCCDDGTDCSGVVNPRHGCVEVLTAVMNKFYRIGTVGCGAICLLTIINMVIAIFLVRRINAKSRCNGER